MFVIVIFFNYSKVGIMNLDLKLQEKYLPLWKRWVSIFYGLKSSFEMMGYKTNAILFIYRAFLLKD